MLRTPIFSNRNSNSLHRRREFWVRYSAIIEAHTKSERDSSNFRQPGSGRSSSATHLLNIGCCTPQMPVPVTIAESEAEPEWHNCAVSGWHKSQVTTADSTHKSQKKIGILSDIFQVFTCRQGFLNSIQT